MRTDSLPALKLPTTFDPRHRFPRCAPPIRQSQCWPTTDPGTGLAVWDSTALDKLSDANRGRYVRGCINIQTRRINARPGVSRLRVRNPRNKQRLARSGQVTACTSGSCFKVQTNCCESAWRDASSANCADASRSTWATPASTRTASIFGRLRQESPCDRGPEPLIRSFQEATHQSRRQSGTNNRDHSRIEPESRTTGKEVQSVRTKARSTSVCNGPAIGQLIDPQSLIGAHQPEGRESLLRLVYLMATVRTIVPACAASNWTFSPDSAKTGRLHTQLPAMWSPTAHSQVA